MITIATILSIIAALFTILGAGGLPLILSQETKNKMLIKNVNTDSFLHARYWLFAGADPNINDIDGWSPLQWAAWRGDLKTVVKLIEKNADINFMGGPGKTPLMLSIRNEESWVPEKFEIFKYLLSCGADTGPSSAWNAMIFAKNRDKDEFSDRIIEILSKHTESYFESE